MAATYGGRVTIPAIITGPDCSYDAGLMDDNCHNIDYRMFSGT
jgi:hypothetical protein